jgi:translation elongation factor EF-1beta
MDQENLKKQVKKELADKVRYHMRIINNTISELNDLEITVSIIQDKEDKFTAVITEEI